MVEEKIIILNVDRKDLDTYILKVGHLCDLIKEAKSLCEDLAEIKLNPKITISIQR